MLKNGLLKSYWKIKNKCGILGAMTRDDYKKIAKFGSKNYLLYLIKFTFMWLNGTAYFGVKFLIETKQYHRLLCIKDAQNGLN